PLRCLHLASFIESCQPRRTAAGTSRISCTARERAPSQSAAPNPRPPTPGIAIVRLLPTRHFSPRSLALAAGLVLAPAAPPAAVVAGVTLLPVVASAQRAELEPIIRRELLENGLEVIVVESHAIPLATVELDVKNG